MLLKAADDHSPRLQLLESLEAQTHWNASQREWLRSQLWALRRGISGERGAAYYIDHAYKDSATLAVIHDLRLELEGEVAQIDHLLVSRGMIFYLLETKSFSGEMHINAQGEFSVRYGTEMRGIPSPLEQSKRHEKLLARYLERLGIGGRFGLRPQFFHAVLLDPKGSISRPDTKAFDTSNVIKADHIEVWRDRHLEKQVSVTQVLKGAMNFRTSDTLREWCAQLVAEHKPLPQAGWLPDFIRDRMIADTPPKARVASVMHAAKPVPKHVAPVHVVATPAHSASGYVCASCGCALTPAVVQFCQGHAQRFAGQLYCMEHQRTALAVKLEPEQKVEATAAPQAVTEQVNSSPVRKKCVCADCGTKITFEEARFCWNQERRFGGLQYCREHQANYR